MPGNGGEQAPGGDQPEAPATPADDERAYEDAFQRFLADDARKGTVATSEPTPSEGESEPAATETPPPEPKFTDQQQQLLSRNHITPEMAATWTPEQRDAFFANAAKRESDQTRAFKELQQRVRELESRSAPGQSQTSEHSQDSEAGEASASNAAGEQPGQAPQRFGERAKQAVEQVLDTFGDEIKPFTELTVSLGETLDTLQQRFEQTQGELELRNRLIADLTLDSGIRGLESDFPSLSSAEARQRVIDRFKSDWSREDNPHRAGEGDLLTRVRAALRDAAKAEFGTTTESAAQVALVNKTKERLKGQPESGAGKGRPRPKTDDDLYEEAFETHLAPELRR